MLHLVGKEDLNHLLRTMSQQQRTLTITVMRISKAQKSGVFMLVKIMVVLLQLLVFPCATVRFGHLVGLLERYHMWKVKKVKKSMKGKRKRPKRYNLYYTHLSMVSISFSWGVCSLV